MSKIAAEDYSPGVAFFSNELSIILDDGERMSLAEYYKDNVADFGQFIKALKVDYIPPASVGLKPNEPQLIEDNFKVVQINKHLTNNSTTKKIEKLKSNKLTAEQSIKKIDKAIVNKKSMLATKKFASKVDKDNQHSELSSLVSKRDTESNLFASIVTEIKATAESNQVSAVKPKFRVRGFWSVPNPKQYGEEISQDIVQFVVRYRYLSTDGKTSTIEQISFDDKLSGVKKTGAFSNWVEIKSPIKKRKFSNKLGKYLWSRDNEEDAQVINFNSLDIPITAGESVEIMVKSLSEAGFPTNPIESEWSDIIKVEFPEEFTIDSATGAVKENIIDSVKIDIKNDLEAKGVYSHVVDSFDSNDKHFSHTSNSIASGFLSSEQNPISLYDKLIEMQMQITALKEAANNAVGKLSISIVDENGNVTNVQNNSVAKVFAGYYIDEIPSSNYKGFIVTKNFKIQLSNTKATNLELASRIIGNTENPVNSSNGTSGWGNGDIVDLAVTNNSYYTTTGQYDMVPVSYQNPELAVMNSYSGVNSPLLQSTQMKGQFIYSRFMDVSHSEPLYMDNNINTSALDDSGNIGGYDMFEYGLDYNMTTLPASITNGVDWTSAVAGTSFAAGGAADFIWSGGSISEVTSISNITSYDDSILIHEDHPILSDTLDIIEMVAGGRIGMPKCATLDSTKLNYKKQNAFRENDTIPPTAYANVLSGGRNTQKISFSSEDQYLLGGRSCGSFLYMSPIDSTSLAVNGNNIFGSKTIEFGEEGIISIDLTFQYRMTDYFGSGSTGTGKIGGKYSSTLDNITYAKKVGFDIIDANGTNFMFDVEVYSKYKASGNSINTINASMLSNYDL
jgi:hypothetical protein